MTKPQAELAQRVRTFLAAWISENLPQTLVTPGRMDAEACRLGFECLVAADKAGIRRQAIERVIGDLMAYMRAAMDERNAKLRRSSPAIAYAAAEARRFTGS